MSWRTSTNTAKSQSATTPARPSANNNGYTKLGHSFAWPFNGMYSSETCPSPAGNKASHFTQANLLRSTPFATPVVTMMYFAPQFGQSKVICSGLLGRQRVGICALIFWQYPPPSKLPELCVIRPVSQKLIHIKSSCKRLHVCIALGALSEFLLEP